ncbi:MAG: YgeY family selenium metabolism-linked hydrolase [Phycisphaerae bacterium]|nr:YgeY family selenium metabolism-linked hydrolase [Phycisphaerae bacterium]
MKTSMEHLSNAAAKHRDAMIEFLRDLVRIPSTSGQEKGVIDRIRAEIQRLGVFDHVHVDGLGNLIAVIGNGPRLIAIDAHVDTVGVGDPRSWSFDPFQGKVDDKKVWGRGAGDQEGAIPPMVYAAKLMRDHGLVDSEFTCMMTFTVMEEDCDGLCWQYIVREGLDKGTIPGVGKRRPEAVVVTDSTNCRILRGQRGRMEIGVRVSGRSCHGSMPEKGDNAIYKMTRVVREIEGLNKRLKKDRFLGNGTIAVTYIDCKTPSLCAIPDAAYIHLDRRLTTGETKAGAIAQVKAACRKAGIKAEVELLRYAEKAYTGLVYPTEKYFPTWVYPETAPQVRAAVETHRDVLRRRPQVGRWTFSTNAVSIAGMFGIPCVGFGPAAEETAHTVNDSVPIRHLIDCAAFYAAYPKLFCAQPRAKHTGRGSRR